MIIDSNLENYVVSSEASVLEGLRSLQDRKGRILFCADHRGHIRGVITNGDIIRWLTGNNQPSDMNASVMSVCNRDFVFARQGDDPASIRQKLSIVHFVPIVDQFGHLIGVAKSRHGHEGIHLGGFEISDASRTFMIAEIGNNHNGDIRLAKKLVDLAKESGADCVKFQMRSMKKLYRESSSMPGENLGTEYTLDLLAKFQLSDQHLFEVFDYCKEQNILALCTPWDKDSLNKLSAYGLCGFKIASADLTNHELLQSAAACKKPLICSTGMSSESEIISAVKLLKNEGSSYVLLHCNSTYPTPYKDVNLRYLKRLKDIGECTVGYSGHERGYQIPVAAVALGAKIIEKHFTLDRSMEGNDHKVSLLPNEFSDMVHSIRAVEEAISVEGARPRSMSQGEMINRVSLAKSLMINCPLARGQEITRDMIEIRSPGQGLQPDRINELVGRRASRDLATGDFFYPSDLQDQVVVAREYNFSRPWGLPVRYHDYLRLRRLTTPRVIEFHLSYRDLDLNLHEFIQDPDPAELVVHAPELFRGDHILDLCSKDPSHLKRSLAEMQRVIDVTRQLSDYFPRSDCPLIVTNIGGFTDDRRLDAQERKERYRKLADSLAALDADRVEIIPQTMPPFPWHFGGQSIHNLFVDPLEIASFCHMHGVRICLDVSHSKLACNTFGWSLSDFIKTIGPYCAHLHLADAAGNNGEGLQIGDGDIDFRALAKALDQHSPDASFIPEIWQGHENNGEGFWIALERLEVFLSDRLTEYSSKKIVPQAQSQGVMT